MPDFELCGDVWGSGGRRGQTPMPGAVEFVLMDVCESFRFTPYRLSKLLGVQNTGSIYRWFSGERTPSALFLLRLAQLLLWDSQGMPVHDISEIIWPDSLIKWKDGSITKDNHEPGGTGIVGDAFTSDVWDVAVHASLSRQRMLDQGNRKGRMSIRTSE